MVVLKFEIFSVTMLAIRVTVEWGSPQICHLQLMAGRHCCLFILSQIIQRLVLSLTCTIIYKINTINTAGAGYQAGALILRPLDNHDNASSIPTLYNKYEHHNLSIFKREVHIEMSKLIFQ